MARIPTPHVQPYEQRLGPGLEAGPAPRARPAVVDGSIGSALQGLGRAGIQASEALRLRDEAEENAWISRTTAEDQLHWTKRQLELRQGAGPGAPEHLKTVEGEWTKYREDRLASAPTPRARQVLAKRYDTMGLKLLEGAVIWSGGERNRKMVGDYNASVEAHAAAVRADPSLLESSLTMAEGDYSAAAGTWMTPEQAQVAKESSRRTIVDGAVDGYLELVKQAKAAGDLDAAHAARREADRLVERFYGARPIPKSQAEREARAIQKFMAAGYTAEQASAVVGNFDWESGGLNPRAIGDKGTAFGMGQWRNDRRTALERYARVRGVSPDDFDVQLEFAIHELNTTEKPAGDRLAAARTVEEAAEAMMFYERPAGFSTDNPRGGHAWQERLARSRRLAGTAASMPDASVASKWHAVIDAAGADAERTIAAAAEKARKAEVEAKLDDLFNGLADGTYGPADIVRARNSGLLEDYGNRERAERILVDRAGGGLAGALEKARDTRRDRETEAARDELFRGLATGDYGERELKAADDRGLLRDYEDWSRARGLLEERGKKAAARKEDARKRKVAGLVTGLRTGRRTRGDIEAMVSSGVLSDEAEINRAYEAADRYEERQRRRDEAARTREERERLALEREAENARKAAVNDLLVRLESGDLTGAPALQAIEKAQRDKILVDVDDINEAKGYVEAAAKATDEERREALLSRLESGALTGAAALQAIDQAHGAGLLNVSQARFAKSLVEEADKQRQDVEAAELRERTDRLHLALIDKGAGREEIDKARETWLSDPQVIQRFYGIVDATENLARKAREALAEKEEKARKEKLEAAVDALHTGLRDGIFGEQDVRAGRDAGWLVKDADIGKAYAILKERQRERETQETRQRAATEADAEAKRNRLNLDLYEGRKGREAIPQARKEGWLTDFGDIKAAEKAAEGPGSVRRLITDGLTRLADPDAVWDPTDPDQRKALDAVWAADGGAERMRVRDDAYVSDRLVPLFRRTGMLPKGAKGALLGMMRSDDPANTLWALATMDKVERVQSDAFRRDMDDATLATLEQYRWGLSYKTPEGLLEELRRVEDPAQAEARKKLEQDGMKLAAKVDDDSIRGWFDSSFLPLTGAPRLPSDPLRATQMRQEFNRLYADSYVRTRDEGAALDMAMKRLSRVWGVTSASGGGGTWKRAPHGNSYFEWSAPPARLMRNPPELVYPTVNSGHDWLRQELARDLQFWIKDGETVRLVSDAQTEKEIQRYRTGQGQGGQKPPPPSYGLVLIAADGTQRALLGKDNRPRRYWWDIDAHMERRRIEERKHEILRPLRWKLYELGLMTPPRPR